MDLRRLKELQEEEKERTKAVVAALKEKIAKQRPISAFELYPELILDTPYTYCLGNISPAVLLPFYQTLIVDIRPLPSPEAFKARYGLSVRDFVKYMEQGRIVIRIRDDFERFADLSYIDDIFRIAPYPPSSTRYKFLYEEDHASLVSTAKLLIGRSKPKDDWWKKEYLDWKKPPSFSEVIANKYALVGCYFGRDTASEIVIRALEATGDPGQAYRWLHIFSRARVYPYMNCLDGINTLSIDDLSQATKLLSGISAKPSIQYKRRKKWYEILKRELQPQTVPYELGKATLSNLAIAVPDDLDKALQIVPSEWMRVIKELDKALEKGSQDQIELRSRNLIRLLEEVRKETLKMKERQSKYANFITLLGLGILGPLAEYAPPEWKPIVQATAASAVILKDLIARSILKFAKPSHIAVWFDITAKLES